MWRDRGERCFILILLACLALLIFQYARPSVDAEMVSLKEAYQKQNESVNVSVDEDNIIWVTGEGMLYEADFKALTKEAKISNKKLKNVIVGDGITEIGYGVFSNLGYLKTLKLGKDVKRVAPGGLRTCSALEYLYLPSGLEDVSTEFLFRCPNCTVVTASDISDVPYLANVTKEDRILTGIDSWEALRASCEPGKELPQALSRWW